MLFVGNGEDRADLEDRAAKTGCPMAVRTDDGALTPVNKGADGPGKIIFAGAVRDREILRAINTRADLFLFPSTFDTNGLVVREAAACGLASVLVAGSCAAEGVQDLRNGFLIEESPESLAAVLAALCREPARMREAGEHAMNELYLSWESAVSTARDLYGAVLEKKKRGNYGDRKRVPGDYFFETAAEAVTASLEAFNYRQELYEGMLENAAGIHARLENIRSKLLH